MIVVMIERTVEKSVNELIFEELSKEAQALRDKINCFRQALGRYFVNKQHLIDLMMICAVSQELFLLVGLLGTVKSDLVLKFKDVLQIPDRDYFEYMLIRFTEPSEVLGPIDINELRNDHYLRREQEKL